MAGLTNVAFWKDARNIVWFRGTADPSSKTGNDLFVLPERYRPGKARAFRVASDDAGCTIVIDSDGTVALTAGTPTEYVSMSNVHFRAAD